MPFPDGVDTVTVTAPANGYRTLDGDYQTGSVTLTPSVREVVSAEHGIIAVGEVNLTISASGSFTPRDVLPCDADGLNLPPGPDPDRATASQLQRQHSRVRGQRGSVDARGGGRFGRHRGPGSAQRRRGRDAVGLGDRCHQLRAVRFGRLGQRLRARRPHSRHACPSADGYDGGYLHGGQ